MQRQQLGACRHVERGEIVVRAIQHLQCGKVLDTLEVGNTAAAYIELSASTNITCGHIAQGIVREHIGTEVGIWKIVGIDQYRIIVGNVDVLIINQAAVLDDTLVRITVVGIRWRCDNLVAIESHRGQIRSNRIAAVTRCLKDDVAASVHGHACPVIQGALLARCLDIDASKGQGARAAGSLALKAVLVAGGLHNQFAGARYGNSHIVAIHAALAATSDSRGAAGDDD